MDSVVPKAFGRRAAGRWNPVAPRQPRLVDQNLLGALLTGWVGCDLCHCGDFQSMPKCHWSVECSMRPGRKQAAEPNKPAVPDLAAAPIATRGMTLTIVIKVE